MIGLAIDLQIFHNGIPVQLLYCKVVIYFTQVANFSPYRLWSDPLLPRHI